MFWDPFFVLIFRDFVFDFGSERVIGFCTSSFSFYRYHMHCREPVWDEGFLYRIFRWVFMGDSFHVSLSQWVFGDLISNLYGLISLGLWDVGWLFSTFVTGSPGIYSVLSESFFYLLDGIPFMTWMLGALLLCHSFRCLIADPISRPYLDSRCFVLCFFISIYFLPCNLSFPFIFSLSFATVP
jgi:hypothetical protein